MDRDTLLGESIDQLPLGEVALLTEPALEPPALAGSQRGIGPRIGREGQNAPGRAVATREGRHEVAADAEAFLHLGVREALVEGGCDTSAQVLAEGGRHAGAPGQDYTSRSATLL